MTQFTSTTQFASTQQIVSTPQKQEIQNRVRRASLKILDMIDIMIDDLGRQDAPYRPPLPVFRRQIANTLALWRSCPQNRCRRSRCCRGEPLHCLSIVFPLMPPDAPLFAMLKKKRARAFAAAKAPALSGRRPNARPNA